MTGCLPARSVRLTFLDILRVSILIGADCDTLADSEEHTMKHVLRLLFVGVVCVIAVLGQEDLLPEPAQKVDAPYRLFRTKNIHTFLRLDTRSGQIWHVQWSIEDDKSFLYPLNTLPLSDGKTTGRFTLVPTSNIYNFILLDQEDGRTWQVQWNTDTKKRFGCGYFGTTAQTTGYKRR